MRVYDAFFADDGGGDGDLLRRPDLSALDRHHDGKSAYDEINEIYRRDMMLSRPDAYEDEDYEEEEEDEVDEEEEEDDDDLPATLRGRAGIDDGKLYRGGAHRAAAVGGAKSVEVKESAAYELGRLRALNTFDARK